MAKRKSKLNLTTTNSPKPGTKAYLQQQVKDLQRDLAEAEDRMLDLEEARNRFKIHAGDLQKQWEEVEEAMKRDRAQFEDIAAAHDKALKMIGRFIIYANYDIHFNEL